MNLYKKLFCAKTRLTFCNEAERRIDEAIRFQTITVSVQLVDGCGIGDGIYNRSDGHGESDCLSCG
ncbi:hypothetical protein DESC_690030 [Desulfosarcina cetonica]|nr:hypothetical protein DESC_690030 [Desulfosarcina cetonica]